MNNIKKFLSHTGFVAKKELKSYLDTPTAYIVVVVFLLLVEFLFFKQVFLIGEASLRSITMLLPWLFLLLIPAMSMGSIAEEKDKGTLEIILTKPIKEIEFVAGKFLAGLTFVSITMLFLFPIAWGLSRFGDLDWGIVFAQYIAGVLLGSVLMSLGIAVSSMFKSQVSSFLVSAVLSLLFLIIGFEMVTASVPHFISLVFERLSALTHYNSMARGVIDLRDIWYILSFVAIMLSFAYLQLIKRKYGNQAKVYRSYKLGVILFIVIAILTNIAGSRIPGRLDLTQGRLFTLTHTTKNILNGLDDFVTVNLYASKNLPAQFQPILRDTTDMLRDYERFSKGNIQLNIKNPTNNNPDIVSEARSYGIREVQFNVVGQEEFKVKQGYLGLAINYGGKSESIPFIQNTGDLEYQLTSFIQQLTNKEKKKIVFVEGHGEKSIYKDYGNIRTELSKQFDINTITLTSSTPVIDSDISVLVFAGPTNNIDDVSKESVKKAIDNGISTMFLLDGVNIDMQFGQITPNSSNIFSFINDEFGISVNKDLVYDLKSRETVNAGGGGFFQLLLPYPLWPRALATDSPHPITTKLNSIVLPWASSININNDAGSKGWEVIKLFSTSKFAGTQSSGKFNIEPNQKFSQTNLSDKLLAIALKPKEENSGKGRVVIVSDSDLLVDQFAKQSVENISFGLESLSWLAQEDSLAGIQLKQSKNRSLLFTKPRQQGTIKYSNLILVILLPICIGLWRFFHRKKLKKQVYK